MNILPYLLMRLRHFYWWKLRMKVEPGKKLEGEWHYVPWREDDRYYGKVLKVIRKVVVTGDPEMGSRPCIEVRLPFGRKKLYLDPSVSPGSGCLMDKKEAEKFQEKRKKYAVS